MAEAIVLGFDCKLYINDEGGSGTVGTPVWLDAKDEVKNATLNLTMGEADVSTRGGGGIMQTEPVLNQIDIDVELIWRNDNAICLLLWDAYFARSVVDVMALTGTSANADAKGVRGDFKVFGFGRKEDLSDAVRIELKLKPCLSLRDNNVVKSTGVAP